MKKTIGSIRGRRVAVVAAAVLVAGIVGVAMPASAAPTDRTVTVTTGGGALNVRESGSTSAKVLRTLANGSRVVIDCYLIGESYHGGPFGVTTSIWDHLASGGGYVVDAMVETGSNGAIVPRCGAQPTPAPAATRETKAVVWGNSQVGSQAYPGLCERFVENAYNMSGRFASAIAAYRSLKASGAIHTNATGIPTGALVFSQGPADGGYGHVMLSRGDGTFVSGGANGPTVKMFSTPNPGSTYLGWAYAPASWPGR